MDGLQKEAGDTVVPALGELLRNSDHDEGYTSSSAPDAQSLKAELRSPSLSRPATPRSNFLHTQPSTRPISILSSGQNSWAPSSRTADVWPRWTMDEYIVDVKGQYEVAKASGKFEEAEKQLNEAIRYSELRSGHYQVPFLDRLQLEEAIATLLRLQEKYGDAVGHVTQLLNEPLPIAVDEAGHIEARQNQLLAEIYLDRHFKSKTGRSLNDSFSDIARAEQHAQTALNLREEHIQAEQEPLAKQVAEAQQTACMKILVTILDERGKTTLKRVFERRLSNRGSFSSADASLHMVGTRETRSSLSVQAVEEETPPRQDSLFGAIHAADLEEVQRHLLDQYRPNLQLVCPEGKTPLIHAVELANKADGNGTILKRLLDPVLGANVNFVTPSNGSALHVAAELGHSNSINQLLSVNADVNVKDRHGETPTHKAVISGRANVVELLYKNGADLSVKSSETDWTLLHHSVHQKEVPMARQVAVTTCLLQLKPGLKDEVDFSGRTALSYCAERNFVEQLQLLIGRDAEINKADYKHRSPLWFAASHPKTPARNTLVEILLDHGAGLDPERSSLPRYAKDYPALRARLEPDRPQTRVKQRSWKILSRAT